MTLLTFHVIGIPQPQGSAKAYMPKGARFPIVTSDNPKLKGWRQQVAEEAGRALAKAGGRQFDGPVEVTAIYALPRPKALKAATPPHVTRPDLDKLMRATGDALSGVVYRDDSQVVALHLSKVYAPLGHAPYAVIQVRDAAPIPAAPGGSDARD